MEIIDCYQLNQRINGGSASAVYNAGGTSWASSGRFHRGLAWLALLLGILIAAPVFANDTVTYYLTDSLHSVVVELDAQRNVLSTTHYGAYGLLLDRSMRDGPGYGGHEEDPATGLNYMQQRYYDPQAGRFVSTDPVLPTEDGGNFNRYWFANDNPYTNIDRDGRETGRTLQAINSMTKPPYFLNDGAGAATLDSLGDALDSLDRFLAPLGAEGGVEFHIAAAPLITGLRKLAKVVKAAEKVEEAGADAERAKNIARGIPQVRLGPSGKPLVHTVEHSTRKAAREAAEGEVPEGGSTRFDAHPQDGQKPHFQAEDAKGNNVKPVVHHCVPNKSC